MSLNFKRCIYQVILKFELRKVHIVHNIYFVLVLHEYNTSYTSHKIYTVWLCWVWPTLPIWQWFSSLQWYHTSGYKATCKYIGKNKIENNKNRRFSWCQTYKQLSLKTTLPKRGPTYRRKVVNPWHQTPQGQSVAKPGTLLQNIIIESKYLQKKIQG